MENRPQAADDAVALLQFLGMHINSLENLEPGPRFFPFNLRNLNDDIDFSIKDLASSAPNQSREIKIKWSELRVVLASAHQDELYLAAKSALDLIKMIDTAFPFTDSIESIKRDILDYGDGTMGELIGMEGLSPLDLSTHHRFILRSSAMSLGDFLHYQPIETFQRARELRQAILCRCDFFGRDGYVSDGDGRVVIILSGKIHELKEGLNLHAAIRQFCRPEFSEWKIKFTEIMNKDGKTMTGDSLTSHIKALVQRFDKDVTHSGWKLFRNDGYLYLKTLPDYKLFKEKFKSPKDASKQDN